jgi:hypothetical protein
MLIAVLGAPTALTYTGCAIVKAITDRANGPHHQIAAVFLDDLRKAWAELPDREGRRQVIIVSDLPSTPLLDLMRSSRVPAIVFVDGFQEIVDQLVAIRGMGLRPALRHATQALCALDQIGEENALRVTKADGGRTLKAFVEALCEFLGVEATAGFAGAIMADLGCAAPGGATLADHVESRLPRPFSAPPSDATDKTLLRFVAKQYAEIGAGAGVERIAWPTELFFQVEPPQDFLAGPTELVGPARFLSYGPYLHLPKGAWIVTITIEVSENFSGNHLVVDVAAGVVLAAGETALPVSGVFSFELSFQIVDPFIAVEVRSQIMSGAIEGKLGLREVVFRRAPASLAPGQARQ